MEVPSSMQQRPVLQCGNTTMEFKIDSSVMQKEITYTCMHSSKNLLRTCRKVHGEGGLCTANEWTN